jgi:hypothetical protein
MTSPATNTGATLTWRNPLSRSTGATAASLDPKEVNHPYQPVAADPESDGERPSRLDLVKENIARIVRGDRLRNVVDKQKSY